MLPSRKFTFQLIPLLDLLLIVVFAQYLEGRIAGERMTERKDVLSRELDEALRQLRALREKMEAAETQSLELDRMRGQRDLIGELVGEMFRIPPETLDQLLQRRTASEIGPSKDDVAQLKSRLTLLAGGHGERVIEHLLTFGELRKRVDVWELYLHENGDYTLQLGPRRIAFRAESSEAFATRLYEAYKTLPEPKSMVLVLVTYGDAKFKPLADTLVRLPLALEKIRADAGSRSRFEYAVLGYRPTPPAAF